MADEHNDIFVEEWKPIAGWAGLYEVSDAGRVRSVAPARTGRVMKQSRAPGWYFMVGLWDGRSTRTFSVHRLVCSAFHGEGVGLQVRHLNGDMYDNRAANLAWGTRSDNMQDRIRHGRAASVTGELHHKAKLTEACVLEIIRLRRSGLRTKEVAERFGVQRLAIRCIMNGTSWKHVSRD